MPEINEYKRTTLVEREHMRRLVQVIKTHPSMSGMMEREAIGWLRSLIGMRRPDTQYVEILDELEKAIDTRESPLMGWCDEELDLENLDETERADVEEELRKDLEQYGD